MLNSTPPTVDLACSQLSRQWARRRQVLHHHSSSCKQRCHSLPRILHASSFGDTTQNISSNQHPHSNPRERSSSAPHPGRQLRPAGFLQLDQLTESGCLLVVWQEQIQPACISLWHELHNAVLQAHSASAAPAEQFQAAMSNESHQAAAQQQQQQLWQQDQVSHLDAKGAEHDCSKLVLYKLDALLGTLQQVLLLCSLIKDRHNQQDWQAAAAAVFVEARSFEQEVCSDMLLQQALLLALEELQCQLDQLKAQQERQQQESEECDSWTSHHSSSRSVTGCSGGNSTSNSDCHGASVLETNLQLARALWKHMQLDGLNPGGFAGLAGIQVNHDGICRDLYLSQTAIVNNAGVLSREEQQVLLSGLLAGSSVLLSDMQGLLLDPDVAPVVELDLDSRQVVLGPVGLMPGAQNIPSRTSTGKLISTDLPAQDLMTSAGTEHHHQQHQQHQQHRNLQQQAETGQQGGQQQQQEEEEEEEELNTEAGCADHEHVIAGRSQGPEHTPAADAAGDERLLLDTDLVRHLLQQHPDPAVRSDVYEVGVLQRLDKLLLLWGDLAESRRKSARMQGYDTYADLVLQHTLLGSCQAATAFCEELVAALAPASVAAVQQLQGQPVVVGPEGGGPELRASDLEYKLQQAASGILTAADVQELSAYLQLSHLLSGFNHLLQASFGVSLEQRAARPCEVWHDGVQVYELHDVLSSKAEGPSTQQGEGVDKQEAVLRTINCSSQGTLPGVASDGSRSGSGWSSGTSSTNNTDSSVRNSLLGTLYFDPASGCATQLLLYGSPYSAGGSGSLGFPYNSPQQQSGSSGHSGSSKKGQGHDAEGCAGAAVKPAVVVGLQAWGSSAQSPLAVFELSHELGHAVNFILNAAKHVLHDHDSRSSALSFGQLESHRAAGDQLQRTQQSLQCDNAAAVGCSSNGSCGSFSSRYHLHASWLPIEVSELPAMLLEVVSMDPACLQVLCRHHQTGQQLPTALAHKLAAYIRHTQLHPLEQQLQAAVMLVDLQLLDIGSKLLGQHGPHLIWQQSMQHSLRGNAAAGGVLASLAQLAALPRLLSLAGQGYGYAVAWCLAQLLQPALLQHLHVSIVNVPGGLGKGLANNTHFLTQVPPAAAVQPSHLMHIQQLWRKFFSHGYELSDPKVLVTVMLELQQSLQLPSLIQSGCADESDELHQAEDSSNSFTDDAEVDTAHAGRRQLPRDHSDLLKALQRQGVTWRLDDTSCCGRKQAMEALAACISTALSRVHAS